MQVGYGLNYYGNDYGDPNGSMSLASLVSVMRIKADNLLPIERLIVGNLLPIENVTVTDLSAKERINMDTLKGSI